jgi:3'-phosphoadenosine 5'-phosphosulfate sulfotransferase (PAPS reductase)/FAD synthetase
MFEIARDAEGVAHVVGVSGGKDSTALALALTEREPRPYTYVYTPTGDELPAMVEHIDRLSALLGRPIIALTNGTLASVQRDQKMLVNARARFCTRILKLKPYGQFMAQAAPAVSYIGLRADEDAREGARPGGDYAAIGTNVRQDFPFRRWGWELDDIWALLNDRGIKIPERTDCARCPYQRLGEWYRLWERHPDIYADAEADEARTGHTFRSAQRDSWPASLAELRARFAAGDKPEISLRMMEKRDNMCRVCSL